MNEASVGHQCPECVAEGRRTQRPARTAFGGSVAGRAGVATRTLIGINVVVMIISIATGGSSAVAGGGWGGLLGGEHAAHRLGRGAGLRAYGSAAILHGVAAGEWYRLITAMFLHYGVLHLLLNMYALWILGRELEASAGPAAVRRASTCWPAWAATSRRTCFSAPEPGDGRRVHRGVRPDVGHLRDPQAAQDSASRRSCR